MKKNSIKYIMLLLVTISMASCELDYENTETITPDNVWTNPLMIKSYVSDIHGGMMPGWPINGEASDEAINAPNQMSDYLKGVIDITSTTVGKFDYNNIDRINYFLQQLASVPTTVLSQAEKDQLEGQMLFWRAWDYWGKIQAVGGVPLILEPQNIDNTESLFIPRSKTSECYAQIIDDLDRAISLLPPTWSGDNYGRIDQCAAAAFKGKVAMWYASPLFNTSNDANRWEAAYSATKTAVEICLAAGKNLNPVFADIWNTERNEEVIMVNQFYNPDHSYFNGGVRPQPITRDDTNKNQPYLPLITAFPKKDGSALTLDPNLVGDEVYDQTFMTDLYTNMDDRFYATIFCPGTVYPGKESTEGLLKGGLRLWTTWENTEDIVYNNSMTDNELGTGLGNSATTGFYSLKGIDPSVEKNTIYNAGMDWVEIRFAEVLMNYAECANETGRGNEAIDVLKQIRSRANAGNMANNYGITANSQSTIREAIMKERFAEFAFEGKRFGDLRRWKRYDILNTMSTRKGFKIVIKDNADLDTFDWTQDMIDATTRSKFKLVYFNSIDNDPSATFNLDLNHWFYAIHKDDIDRNPQLEQNNEWGGSFDPLQ